MAMTFPPTTTAARTETAAAADFVFPREYDFPPFFTPQTNLTTRHSQLTKWSSLVLAYCRHHRIFRLSPSAAATDPAHPAAPLFHNARLSRRLTAAGARDVLDFMRREGRAESIGSGGGVNVSIAAGTGTGTGTGMGIGTGDGPVGGTDGDLFWIYWRTPDEWAALVESWIDDTGQKGSVLTVYELVEGPGTVGKEFHGIDTDLLVKSLGVLVKRGKASIFGNEDSPGVKFY